MRVLIIGGYGTFGYRIAERLSDEAELHIVLAGRSFEKADHACQKLRIEGAGQANFHPLLLDRNIPLAAQIDIAPHIIIDASGPFQNYQNQAVIEYALDLGCDYADIADDGAFVASLLSAEMKERAAQKGITIVSGLSTCSVLSAIGLRQIEAKIGPITDVTVGIAPSPKADLGRNVVAAVASYAGQKTVSVRRDGQRQTVAGLTETRQETICAPGQRPLPSLRFAVADAPDSWVLPNDFPELANIWTGAGTRPAWLQGCLVLMSRLLAKLPFGSLSPLADFFHRARGWFPFGDHRGGIFVRGSNESGTASWHLIAEGDDGPMIPALPAVAFIRRSLRGNSPSSGAFAGHEVVEIDELVPEFNKLNITHGLHHDSAKLPVYEAVMGDSYARLHPAISDLHRTGEGRVFRGECEITRGRNPISHIIATLFRLPEAGRDIPVKLNIVPEGKGERWTRNFGGRLMSSHHQLGRGRQARIVVERFGPVAVHLGILEEASNLRIRTQGWSCFGVPLPKWLTPGGDVYETEKDGRFVFHVDLQAPLIGRLVKYVGWLEPA